jgi:FkbM family methyltransferase
MDNHQLQTLLCNIGPRQATVVDQASSMAAAIIIHEMAADRYGLDAVALSPGDVVVDIGAHIGIFSMFLAIRHPDIIVHAYEPYPDNAKCLDLNLRANHVRNVTVHGCAVTADRRPLEMVTNPCNSGGATAHSTTLSSGRVSGIPSVTLEDVFQANHIERCRLLKLDCEGSEHEILLNTTILDRVDYLAVESHTNDALKSHGYSCARLRQHCVDRVRGGRVRIINSPMSE